MIGLLGLSYKTAPVEVRENFVFNEDEIVAFAAILKKININGVFILSTCNRTEIYFEIYSNSCKANIFKTLIKNLKEFKDVNFDISPYFYQYNYSKLISHLFNVAAGIDSMALGEYQIVKQIKEALCLAEKNEIISTVLLRLVRKSLEAGKSLRTATNMNKGAMSVSYAAVEQARKLSKDFSESKILLVGAGQTGELVVQNLVKKGVKNIFITNRTIEKSDILSQRYKGKVIEFEHFLKELYNFDIILTSTTSNKPLIISSTVKEALEKRKNKPMVFIDLSVPRNIAEDVGMLENVSVHDIDSLETVVKENYDIRKKEMSNSQQFLDKHINEFKDWESIRKLSPAIKTITHNFKKINKKELEGFKRINSSKTDDLIDDYSNHITNKFIGLLIKNMKDVTENGKREELLNVVNDLFILES